MLRPLTAVLAMMLAHLPATAQTGDCINSRYNKMVCPPPDAQCMLDSRGDVLCSPSGGAIRQDRFRATVCGKGQCVSDRFGEIRCSNTAKGAATLDRYMDAACTDGCHTASADLCSRPAQR